MASVQFKISSPLGTLYLVASAKGIQGLYFEKQNSPLITNLNLKEPAQKLLAQAATEIAEYFAGQRKAFDVSLDLEGSGFQLKVWQELLKIPYGETRTYAEVARRLKSPKAYRAVGSANGKNPICIFVPCHRVVAAGGRLGGYSGGLDKKLKLLSIEGVTVAP
jgi:methylated-DNA-[protein]-cysteine S-methyltransferase